MAVNQNDLNYALKTLWPQKRIINAVYADHAFMALVPKDEGFVGKNLVLGLRYADTQGRSASFARAQANIGAHKGAAFTLTRVKDYALFSIDTETLKSSASDKGSLVAALDAEMSSTINNIGASAAHALFNDGSGVIGQVASIATNTITLTNSADIVFFEVGKVLRAGTTRTGAVRNTSTIRMTITGVDRDLGTVTCAAGLVTGLANADFLFSDGDEQDAGAAKKLSGLRAWLPDAAPGATPFFGVDRTADVTRLGGLRFDASALTPEEALVTSMSRLAREGGRPDYLVCNHVEYRNIEIALGSKVQYEPLSVGGVGFSSLKIDGPKGIVRVIADQDCQQGRAFALQMNTWKLRSLGAMPMKFDEDGAFLSREASNDAWEGRVGYFAQLGCEAPGYNMNIVMP